MRPPVKSIVVRTRKKRRSREVKEKKGAKIEALLTDAEKARVAAACEKRHQAMSAVLRALALAYAAAVEEGRSTDGELEVRSKPSA